MSKDHQDFEAFLKQRESAARAYTTGNAEPVTSLSTHVSPATFFCPGGGAVVGAAEVLNRYEGDARSFLAGGETHFEVLQSASGDALGFWTGFQHARIRLRDKPEPAQMKLRVTEVFRREGSDWKLIHRHADALGDPQPPKAA